MKYLITIEHPAWAHQFKGVISKLLEMGHSVEVLAIKQDVNLQLLDAFGISYKLIGNSTGKNLIDKAWIFTYTFLRILKFSIAFRPDVYIGRASPMVALVAWLHRRPHIIYEDTERGVIALWFCKRFSKLIITPKNFKTDLGKIHLKVDSFKEHFYLHKQHFTPEKEILDILKVDEKDKFIIVRFIAWAASHDIGEKGFSSARKIELIQKLSKKYKVFITSESALPNELKPFQIKIPIEKIHSALYFAHMYIGESGTMTTESALLGTPAVRISTIAKKLGNFSELQDNYDLLYFFDDEVKGINKVFELLEYKNIKKDWKVKLQKLESEKLDIQKFYIWVIENYPDSIAQIEANPNLIEAYKR